MQINVRCVGDEHDFDLEIELGILLQISGYETIAGVVCPSCGARMDVSVARILAVANDEEEGVDLGSVSERADAPAPELPDCGP